MKKKSFFMLSAVFAIALLVWVGCTTSQATDAAKVSVEEITTRWEGSGHADITSEAFTHWNEDDPAEIPATCAKCHSTSGFRDFVGADGSAAGSVEMAGLINDPVTCTASDQCHDAGTCNPGTGFASASVSLARPGRTGSARAATVI